MPTHFVFHFRLIVVYQWYVREKTKRNALFQIGARLFRRSRRTRKGVVWRDPKRLERPQMVDQNATSDTDQTQPAEEFGQPPGLLPNHMPKHDAQR